MSHDHLTCDCDIYNHHAQYHIILFGKVKNNENENKD